MMKSELMNKVDAFFSCFRCELNTNVEWEFSPSCFGDSKWRFIDGCITLSVSISLRKTLFTRKYTHLDSVEDTSHAV